VIHQSDVAIVGGGPAGSALAIQLAGAGRQVVVIERSREPAWRACGVFASPAAVATLRALGIDGLELATLARPIPAMRVETPRGTSFRLTYGDDGRLTRPPVGFDRPALDRTLLAAAETAGADVRRGCTVIRVDLGRIETSLTVRTDRGEESIGARVVVGADGIHSLVARAAGVVARTIFGERIGLTFHAADPEPTAVRDARMVVLRGAYCGLAPVPGGRVNVGIVLADRRWRERLARAGAQQVGNDVLEAIPRADDDPVAWATAQHCDAIVGASPVGHRVTRRAGEGWLLVGDAAGFLDPFTGEGLHRALVSAVLAAGAISDHLRSGTSLATYERAMSARFRAKDVTTILVQAFLARPSAFEYAARRLAARRDVRETMGLVIGDLLPASRALDPRFLTALVRP
jgi:flavin-dependent dehydrogenase